MQNHKTGFFRNGGRKLMDLEEYCDGLKQDLTLWKAKTYDLIREADKISPASRDRVAVSIKELHHVIETIDKEIKRLERECPVEWEAEKEAMKVKFKELEEESEKVWKDLSPDDY
jgi:hypothetical protein